MNTKKVELVEINIDISTGFDMFLSPVSTVLRFNRVVHDSTPNRFTPWKRQSTHKTSMAKSAKRKNTK